jgi:hypothetical protein
MRYVLLFVLVAGAFWSGGARAADNPDTWDILPADFPSTGGGGIMIRNYRPVVVGDTCVTDFAAVEPNGTTYLNAVTFDAVPFAGGTLCQNGRWRSLTGPATGTTSLKVFIKDGIVRRVP